MSKKVKKLIDEKPQLILEWDFQKNPNSIDPYSIAAYSTKRVWWKCSKCNYEWMADVKHRYQGRGGPACANVARSVSAAKVKPISLTYNLTTTNSELIDEWNQEKNNTLTPDMVTPGSGKKVWWKCRVCCNEWQAIVSSRVNGSGCPYCSGRRVIAGVNDLATLNPELMEEWCYKKNDTSIDLEKVAPNSHKKVWWKCKVCGNEWQSAISDRVRGNGCPICSFSNRTSEQEQILFYYVKSIFPEAINSFRPEWLNGGEIDIFIPSLKIGIEYDGSRWHQDVDKDLRKDKLIDAQGIVLFRIREDTCPKIESTSRCIEVHVLGYEKDYMINAINQLFIQMNACSNVSITSPDIDLQRDSTKILSLYEGNKKNKSLAILSPSIASEWNYEKNNGLLPQNISNKSNKKVWWKCSKCGYEWEATVNNRIKRGCPACSNKVVWEGHNDIATTYPGMVALWDNEKNGDLQPNMFTPGAEKKVWWKCQVCGFEWEAMIYHIKHSFDKNVNGVQCPACVGKTIWKGHNDLKTLRPDLAIEWNNKKNGGQTPDEITLGSTKSIWWKCQNCGHEWHTSPYNRAKNGSKCPVCVRERIKAQRRTGTIVRCVETGQIYMSASEAGKALGKTPAAILHCIKNPLSTCGGFHWEKFNK